MYRTGLSQSDVNEDSLVRSGLKFKIVEPREQIIASAKSVLGKPHKRGVSVLRDAPNLFECSSLTAWAAVEAGYAIPRVSIDQFVFSKRINKENLEPGDLIFSNSEQIISTEGSYYSQVLGREVKEEPIRYETLEYLPGTKVLHGVDHVGIYAENNQVIHSTNRTGCVVEENLTESPSFKNIVGYGRIIDNEDKRFVIEIPDDRLDLRNRENLVKEIHKYA